MSSAGGSPPSNTSPIWSAFSKADFQLKSVTYTLTHCLTPGTIHLFWPRAALDHSARW